MEIITRTFNMSYRTECVIFLKTTKEIFLDNLNPKSALGEVDSGSIIDQKAATKIYWESKMLTTVDDGGWETVANVQFQTAQSQNKSEEDPTSAVPPPPEFSVSADQHTAETSALDEYQETKLPLDNIRPSRQYVYGSEEEIIPAKKPSPIRVIELLTKRTSHENVIEAEIRQQQLREESLREEAALRTRDKVGGASSPSSHASDEGFVDRPPEEISTPPPSSSSPVSQGFTHTITGSDGEPVIYDAVNESAELFTEKSPSAVCKSSETKIALEIRELREREAELRAMRELREREQLHSATLDDEEDIERASSSSRDPLDDHLTSITTTTDEGNFSEYGDPASSEDKSSDGSNSRIMSPDLHSFGSHAETRQRKVTVKPFEDDEVEEQPPVYIRMKNESVIEREVRLAKEREDAFRLEKGLPLATSQGQKVPSQGLKSVPTDKIEGCPNILEGKRGSQRISSSFIQQDIAATVKKEIELKNTGQIRTLSEDTVDSKVTRMSDLANERKSDSVPRLHLPHSAKTPFNRYPEAGMPISPINKTLSSPVSPMSHFNVPAFTPSPTLRPPAPSRLTRSLSTNNLSSPFSNLSLPFSNTGTALRPPKGLMQKFIASRGKITAPTFVSPVASTLGSASRNISPVITTRPMTMKPKSAVFRSEIETNSKTDMPPARVYKRTHATAEEKIQVELKEMKRREEELRRLRARSLGRSQPNLTGIGLDEEEETSDEDKVDSTCLLPEVNGLRTALSDPNLLDDESDQCSPPTAPVDKGVRRRSALIAHWEGRIQQTADT